MRKTRHATGLQVNNSNLHTTEKVNSENKQLTLSVTEGIEVTIIPNHEHEYLMSTKEVAKGYGVTEYVVRQNKSFNLNEFEENKHFVKGVRISHTLPNAQPHKVFWTKRGIIRLGFFIKSEKAKFFRDWAEDLVMNRIEGILTAPIKIAEGKRKHNRLTQERLIDILTDVCQIENNELRIRIADKLKGGML